MANLPLAFAEMIGGGVLLLAGISGDSLGNVVKGQITWKGLTSGTGASTSGVSGSTSAGSSTSGGVSGNTTGIPQPVVNQVNAIAKAKGWGQSEIDAWLGVINAESGGNLTAQNPSSNAYGIAQFINGPAEYAQYGGNSTTITGQLTAMANYISQRYGTPSAAIAHENSSHWY